MCSYLYSVCLVSRVVKNPYFKEQLSVVASKYSICDMENNTCEFKLCSMFKHRPNGKAWFMAPMEYSPNGRGIMDPMEYPLVVYSPNVKVMVKDLKNTA